MTKLSKALLVALTISASGTAMAATEQYGTLLGTGFQPDVPFASLDVTGSGSVYNFTLTAYDLNAIFAPGSFIGAIVVDTNSSLTPTISNVSGGSPVSFSPGGGPGGSWDFRFDLTGPKQARLVAGESVSWTATFAQPVSFVGDQFALKVQGGNGGWYTNTVAVSPVPEPETYAMFLGGLGLMGAVARRKKKQS